MIVDAHVHLLPGRLGAKVRDFFLRHLPLELAYPNDHATVLAAHAEAGIGEVWNLPYAHKPGVAEGLNEASAALAQASPHPGVRIVGGATAHPGDDDPERVVGTALDVLGLRVLKLHCSVGGFSADDARLDALWRLVERRCLPTVVHVGHDVTGRTHATELASLARIARRHPGAPLIIAHTAHPSTAAALALVAAHPNVHADLTPVIDDPVALPDAELEARPDRFLFGSDAPNVAIRAETGLARLRTLSPGTRTAIEHGNAQRLQSELR
ncbi:amidohydrolase family protein [Spirillospora sp. NPDC048911]|uniref:amidohydrolase family protein n=1 Tax=Spirillospora sp. NPDC048911 TaxID=3364527 RepID=UPI00371D0274